VRIKKGYRPCHRQLPEKKTRKQKLRRVSALEYLLCNVTINGTFLAKFLVILLTASIRACQSSPTSSYFPATTRKQKRHFINHAIVYLLHEVSIYRELLRNSACRRLLRLVHLCVRVCLCF
jgi:hypothetical protein